MTASVTENFEPNLRFGSIPLKNSIFVAITILEAVRGLQEVSAKGSAEKLTFLRTSTVANWRWQRVAISALHAQSLVF
jgi:hypothetical protein